MIHKHEDLCVTSSCKHIQFENDSQEEKTGKVHFGYVLKCVDITGLIIVKKCLLMKSVDALLSRYGLDIL